MRGAVEKSSAYARCEGHKSAYRLGCEQMLAWKHRRARLQRCTGCGRLIDGVLKRGFCVWCQSMNDLAKFEIQREETRLRLERKAAQQARDAERRAAKKAAKEVA